MNMRPFFKSGILKSGFLRLLGLLLTVTLIPFTAPSALYALTDDGATEALALRYHAELAITQEEQAGRRDLAMAMRDTLSPLLKEYLITRDGTIALDTVDATFVREQFKVARAMEEPGVALAMDIYAGEATGFEHDLQTSLSRLADHHADIAERAQEHADRGLDRAPERIVDAYERQIERQLDKVEHDLEKVGAAAGRLDAKFEAKFDAKLDAAAARAEAKTAVKALRQELQAEVTAAKAEAREEQKAAKDEVKVEKAKEKAAEKIEKAAEKAVEKVEKAAEKAEQKAEKVEEKVEKKDKDDNDQKKK